MSRARAAGTALAVLMAVLPFEPRRPTLDLAGLRFTLLELIAAGVLPMLAWSARDRLRALIRRPPWPLALLAAFAAVHVASAAWAPAMRGDALAASLRMVAAASFAVVVAASTADTTRPALPALGLASLVVALLAILEGAGAVFLDPMLDLFRSGPSLIEGARRAMAGSEHPNLAASWLMCGIVLVAARSRAAIVTAVLAIVLSAGLLSTYSRGALAAAVLTLGALALVDRRADGRVAAPRLVLGALLATTTAFLLAHRTHAVRLGLSGPQPPASGWSARYDAPEVPALAPAERRTVAVRIANAGTRTWPPVRMVARWYDPRRRTLRDEPGAWVATPMPPGATETSTLEITAPEEPGAYVLAFDLYLVEDARTSRWFRDLGVPPVLRGVGVGGAVPPASPFIPDGAYRPGRRETWRLALSMWSEHPWLGIGSDGFRRLKGTRGGASFSNRETSTDNAYVEAAVDTGVLGLAAFVACGAAALLAAWRARRVADDAWAVAGLLAALALQGLTEHVLAFTGHYLLFGFLVGAAARFSRAAPAPPGSSPRGSPPSGAGASDTGTAPSSR
jgi:hypothetical protein